MGMADDLTSVEVVGLAIRSEEEASKFYGGIAKRITNALVKARYEDLARDEVRHRKLLVALYRQMTGDEFAPDRIPGDPEVAEGAWPAGETEDLDKLIGLAIQREKQAAAFYDEAAAKARDATGRQALLYLADMERGHALILEGELRAYQRDRTWYSDFPDMQLMEA
jgi:rubrerythrin